MSAEILTATPVSGEFQEVHFGDHFNSRLWVKFTDNQFQDWVGCFSKGHPNARCITMASADNTTAFVVAGGVGYLVDIQNRKLIIQLEEYPSIESAVVTTNPDYFVAGTFNSIYILNNTGLLKEINPDETVDGIYLKKQDGNKATGDLAAAFNQYAKNVNFELDLITFELKLKHERK